MKKLLERLERMSLIWVILLGFLVGAIAQPLTQVATSLAFISPTGAVIMRTAANGIDVIFGSHIDGSSAPVANSCAGFALAGGASDVGGTITYTSAATCSITFGRAFVAAPTCIANAVNAGTPAVGSVATTTTGFIVTFAAAQTVFEYACIGA